MAISSWKELYLLISQLIDRLNGCFGFTLLVFITFVFVRAVVVSFYMLLDFHHVSWSLFTAIIGMAFIGLDLTYLLSLAVIVHQIRQEVFILIFFYVLIELTVCIT